MPARSTPRWSDGTEAVWETPSLGKVFRVSNGDVIFADDYDRMWPDTWSGRKKIYFFSWDGTDRTWKLPADWAAVSDGDALPARSRRPRRGHRRADRRRLPCAEAAAPGAVRAGARCLDGKTANRPLDAPLAARLLPSQATGLTGRDLQRPRILPRGPIVARKSLFASASPTISCAGRPTRRCGRASSTGCPGKHIVVGAAAVLDVAHRPRAALDGADHVGPQLADVLAAVGLLMDRRLLAPPDNTSNRR